MRRFAPYLAACAIVVAFFAVAESVRPYYFFQDDNRDIFLPFYLHNYRAALDGQLAQFNFFQSLGKPHFATGQVAGMHPIPYLAIFLSNALFGHVFASIEIYVLIYLLLGAAGMVFLVRTLGFSNFAAVFGAVSWVLTPFNMLVSQSWTTWPPVIGLLPWMLASALLIYRRRYGPGALLFIASHLALIYAGFPQFVLYAGATEAGLILVLGAIEMHAGTLTRAQALRTAGVYALLVVLVTGLAMPLLLPMWNQAQLSAFRSGRFSYWGLRVCSIGPIQFFNGLFVPFYRFYPDESGEWCGTTFPASFPHPGYLTIACAFAYPWVRKKLPAEQRRVLDAAAAIAIVLLLAMMGYLTHIIQWIPVANRFRWPFKYFGYANMMFVLCAIAAFDLLRARIGKSGAVAALIAVQFLNLIWLDLTFRNQAFFEHADPVPLAEPLRERLGAGRIISVGWKSAATAYTLPTIGYDYATLWELHNFGGYDPLVPAHNHRLTYRLDYTAILTFAPDRIHIDYLRFWGVRWYVLNKPWSMNYEPVFARKGLRRVHEDAHRVLLEDPYAGPLVEGSDCATRSIGRHGDDLVAAVDCRTASEVRLRFLYNPLLSASVDDRPVPIERKASSQMTIPVPAGRHHIRLAYDDPSIDVGLGVAGLTAGLALILAIVWRRSLSPHGVRGSTVTPAGSGPSAASSRDNR